MYSNRCKNLTLPRINIDKGSSNFIAQNDENNLLLLSPKLQTAPIIHTPRNAVARSSPGLTMPGFSTPRSPSKRLGAYRPSVFAHRLYRRAVFKNGTCNVAPVRVSRKHIRFLQDMFTTLVDARWRYTLLVFALGFVGSWLFFALLYWFIAFAHGDLEEAHLPHNQDANNWKPCISNIYTYASCFLFSLETQHTIGYGNRATTEECPEAIFVMSLQSVHGVMIQALLAGIIFAKMTRPKSRSQTLLFSKQAVISMRDGELCLMFRVGDMRKSHIIGAKIRALLIQGKMTSEGEVMAQYQMELDVEVDGCGADMFFIWPQIVVHRINASSPLYNLSALELLQEKFEIIVILEGTIESTGQTTQARSSYLSSEILWGYRFDPILFYNKQRQTYEINLAKFDEPIPVETPGCSARETMEGAAYSSHENLIDKRPFEYVSLVEKLQHYQVEDEKSQPSARDSVCYQFPPTSGSEAPLGGGVSNHVGTKAAFGVRSISASGLKNTLSSYESSDISHCADTTISVC
ncbi:G protein-activated inward rectifier potassium channel 3-like [Sabethes cyaneus]|uniref:G protein-activated inward rectifier potassium channel 3-like n=1 Tax=Sabethes cyaneus TaxID=53552 RepID=UPI00237D59DE|nr:G protein-activated inward rectifier potassium channel 3-like [Sabethes cyaneus]